MKIYYEPYELRSKFVKRVFSHVFNKAYQLYVKITLVQINAVYTFAFYMILQFAEVLET